VESSDVSTVWFVRGPTILQTAILIATAKHDETAHTIRRWIRARDPRGFPDFADRVEKGLSMLNSIYDGRL
jgi:hypothetical protein